MDNLKKEQLRQEKELAKLEALASEATLDLVVTDVRKISRSDALEIARAHGKNWQDVGAFYQTDNEGKRTGGYKSVQNGSATDLLEIFYAAKIGNDSGSIIIGYSYNREFAHFYDFNVGDVISIFHQKQKPVCVFNHATNTVTNCFDVKSITLHPNTGVTINLRSQKFMEQFRNTIYHLRGQGLLTDRGREPRAKKDTVSLLVRKSTTARDIGCITTPLVLVTLYYLFSQYNTLLVLFGLALVLGAGYYFYRTGSLPRRFFLVFSLVLVVPACFWGIAPLLKPKRANPTIVTSAPTPLPNVETARLPFSSNKTNRAQKARSNLAIPFELDKVDVIYIESRRNGTGSPSSQVDYFGVKPENYADFKRTLSTHLRRKEGFGSKGILSVTFLPHIRDANGQEVVAQPRLISYAYKNSTEATYEVDFDDGRVFSYGLTNRQKADYMFLALFGRLNDGIKHDYASAEKAAYDRSLAQAKNQGRLVGDAQFNYLRKENTRYSKYGPIKWFDAAAAKKYRPQTVTPWGTSSP